MGNDQQTISTNENANDCTCNKTNYVCTECDNSCPSNDEICTCGCGSYIYVYNISAQTVAPNVAVTFDSQPVLAGGFQYTSPQNYIVITQPGVYKYEYYFSVVGGLGEIAINLNNTVVIGTTRYYSDTTIMGSGIFKVTCNNTPGTLQIVNVNANMALVASVFPGVVNASVLITRIN